MLQQQKCDKAMQLMFAFFADMSGFSCDYTDTNVGVEV
jgi:hypothetical protein